MQNNQANNANLNNAPVAAIRPEVDNDEYASEQGFGALSMTGKVLAGAGLAAMGAAAGYGAFKGTAALVAGEAVVAGEGMAAASLVGGLALSAVAPIAAAVAVGGAVAYGGYKAVDHLTKSKKKITGRQPQTTDGAAWPFPAPQQQQQQTAVAA